MNNNDRIKREVKLCCPKCKILLKNDIKRLFCEKCAVFYPIIDEIPSFIEDSKFYEGRWVSTEQDEIGRFLFLPLAVRKAVFNIWISVSLSQRRKRFFRKVIKRQKNIENILDLGCGGGKAFLGKIDGNVTGIDISMGSLQKAKKYYNRVVQGCIKELPFEDNTFDCIISDNVLGHIPSKEKNVLFNEIDRVLKRGGLTAHIIEAESNSLQFRFAKKHPELYKKYVINTVGHVGLELPSKIIERFRRIGYKAVCERKQWGLIWNVGCYSLVFDNEFKDKSKIIWLIVFIDKIFSKNLYLREMINCILGPISDFLELFLPFNNTDMIMVQYRKTK